MSQTRMPGIFITRGMSLTIPSFSIQVGKYGELESDPVSLHVRFDVTPTWIQIAKRHVDEALAAKARRDDAWKGNDEDAKAKSLELEFESSVQAIMAVAITWDALYAVLREHVIIPPAMAEKWRRGGTARYSQIAEVVRRGFSLKPKGASQIRRNLKEIFRYRDMAVHPSGKIAAPILHPELDVGMEWRFVYFRAGNAEMAFIGAAGMLWDLAHNGRSKNPKITEYQKLLVTRLQEVFPAGAPKVPVHREPK